MGTDPAGLINEICRMGHCRVVAHLEKIPELRELDPENCSVNWDMVLTMDRGVDAIRDVFIFVEDDSETSISTFMDVSELSKTPRTKSWARSSWNGATFRKTI